MFSSGLNHQHQAAEHELQITAFQNDQAVPTELVLGGNMHHPRQDSQDSVHAVIESLTQPGSPPGEIFIFPDTTSSDSDSDVERLEPPQRQIPATPQQCQCHFNPPNSVPQTPQTPHTIPPPRTPQSAGTPQHIRQPRAPHAPATKAKDVWTFYYDNGTGWNKCIFCQHINKSNPSHEIHRFCITSSSTNLRKHLFDHHQTAWFTACDKLQVKVTAKFAQRAFAAWSAQALGVELEPEGMLAETAHFPFLPENFVNALVDWIVSDDQNPKLQAIFMMLREDLQNHDIPHRTKLRERIHELWKENFDSLLTSMKNALGKISFTTDIWTDPIMNPFLAVHSSSLRRQYFSDICRTLYKKDIQLIRDVDTCWSSTLYMIERAVSLRAVITQFLEIPEFSDLRHYTISDAEWKGLEIFTQVLSVPDAFQHRLSGAKTPTLSEAIPAFEAMIYKWKHQQTVHPEISSIIQAGIDKLTVYHQRAQDIPAYIVSMVLNPSMKLGHFYKHRPEDVLGARRTLMNELETYYSSSAHLAPQQPLQVSPTDTSRLENFPDDANVNEDGQQVSWADQILGLEPVTPITASAGFLSLKAEVDAYLAEPSITGIDRVGWKAEGHNNWLYKCQVPKAAKFNNAHTIGIVIGVVTEDHLHLGPSGTYTGPSSLEEDNDLINDWKVDAGIQHELDMLKPTHRVCPLPAFDENFEPIKPEDIQCAMLGSLIEITFELKHWTMNNYKMHNFAALINQIVVLKHNFRAPLTPSPYKRIQNKPVYHTSLTYNVTPGNTSMPGNSAALNPPQGQSAPHLVMLHEAGNLSTGCPSQPLLQAVPTPLPAALSTIGIPAGTLPDGHSILNDRAGPTSVPTVSTSHGIHPASQIVFLPDGTPVAIPVGSHIPLPLGTQVAPATQMAPVGAQATLQIGMWRASVTSMQAAPPTGSEASTADGSQFAPPIGLQVTCAGVETTAANSLHIGHPAGIHVTSPSSMHISALIGIQVAQPSGTQVIPPSSMQIGPVSGTKAAPPSALQAALPSTEQATLPSAMQATCSSAAQVAPPPGTQVLTATSGKLPRIGTQVATGMHAALPNCNPVRPSVGSSTGGDGSANDSPSPTNASLPVGAVASADQLSMPPAVIHPIRDATSPLSTDSGTEGSITAPSSVTSSLTDNSPELTSDAYAESSGNCPKHFSNPSDEQEVQGPAKRTCRAGGPSK
ncbi:hypothetical protein NP233_g4249 [Leucocoprinus birnbaumii]|uniref:BED-type domain-containing protein n=1 Tax=Leucocoprinus birnbaumii TaxID=56174 RepID=A0AAD5VV06_9AGAR|nr:hypothetical protein NP233_g4249 [Leucocoprinus birnbaumii]